MPGKRLCVLQRNHDSRGRDRSHVSMPGMRLCIMQLAIVFRKRHGFNVSMPGMRLRIMQLTRWFDDRIIRSGSNAWREA